MTTTSHASGVLKNSATTTAKDTSDVTCGPFQSWGNDRKVGVMASIMGEARLCIFRKVGDAPESLWAEIPAEGKNPSAFFTDKTVAGLPVTYRAEIRCPATIHIQCTEKDNA